MNPVRIHGVPQSMYYFVTWCKFNFDVLRHVVKLDCVIEITFWTKRTVWGQSVRPRSVSLNDLECSGSLGRPLCAKCHEVEARTSKPERSTVEMKNAINSESASVSLRMTIEAGIWVATFRHFSSEGCYLNK